jgi:hypothetical protein
VIELLLTAGCVLFVSLLAHGNEHQKAHEIAVKYPAVISPELALSTASMLAHALAGVQQGSEAVDIMKKALEADRASPGAGADIQRWTNCCSRCGAEACADVAESTCEPTR